jgi:hypothetical protein
MIDYTEIRRDLEFFLQASFTECVIKFENVQLTVIDPVEFIAVHDNTGESVKTQLGSPTQRTDGFVIIQIFTELYIGTERSKELATILSNMLVNQVIGDATYGDSELVTVGEIPESVYFQQNLRINYVFGAGGQCNA